MLQWVVRGFRIACLTLLSWSSSTQAFDPPPRKCIPILQDLAVNPSEAKTPEAKEAKLNLQKSYFYHGSRYDSSRSHTAEDLLKIFPAAISFSNEAEVWDLMRDRALIESHQHPDRYVVSTGLQQSLELLFAGAPKLVMTDAYGPNVAAFALLSERAKAHLDRTEFFLDVASRLKIIASTGEGPSSWFGGRDTVDDFLLTLKEYGEEGFRNFRNASISGHIKAYLQDLGDSDWGADVRRMTGGKSPSFIYTSNIFNWIRNDHIQNYAKNLQTLSVDYEDLPNWQRLFSKRKIVYGSTIAQTSITYTGFSHEINRLWDLKIGPADRLRDEWRKFGFSSSATSSRRVDLDELNPLNRFFVRVVSSLTQKEMYQGILKIHDDQISIGNLKGWDIEIAYDPRLHRIEATEPPPQISQILNWRGRSVKIQSKETKQIQDLVLLRPQKIIPQGGGYMIRWKARDDRGRSVDFTFDPERHELIEISKKSESKIET